LNFPLVIFIKCYEPKIYLVFSFCFYIIDSTYNLAGMADIFAIFKLCYVFDSKL